ncbi:hypothetical protein CRENBAI_023533 [Crenichthys baileyi]|uniref:Uncharacterized protein n=1 Tax=Crenichthys baileyi TaxID=28760 RepID=A0AAV9RHX7_9TELE
MRRRFTVNEALDHIFAANEAEDTQDFSDGDEQASENEHDVEYQLEETDTTDQSEEEVTGAEAAPAESFQSKRGNIRWSTVPPDVHGRTAAANIIKMTPGVTRFAVTRVFLFNKFGKRTKVEHSKRREIFAVNPRVLTFIADLADHEWT